MSVTDVTSQARQNPVTFIAILASIIVTVSSSIIVWTITSRGEQLMTLSKNQAAMRRGQIEMKEDLAWMRNRLLGVYTQEEADKTHDRIYKVNQDQYTRLNALDSRVEALERKAN